jgi:membrane protease YdiL (CAAX protease family)
MGLLQPIGEELVFRGMLFPRLKHALGSWSGYLFTSVIYAVFHLIAYAPAGGGSPALFWYTLAVPFLDSLFITLVRANTRSTRAAMVAHAGIGIFSVLRAYIIAG